MSKTAISIEQVSKQYRLGTIGTATLKHDFNRFIHRVLGKEDPYLHLGETNDRTTIGNSEYVWALRDISFDIQQGDVVGIIGRNGAGKSTLLKILSKTTSPTLGQIKINGRVASLLEVGTGFHPELTGRENIFLNGAILGMRKKEIARKLDEIVHFAGVERYLDTPVKRYSSGMYVRLAFGVAAHLESEILIVDEVLAVGDAEFQKKCLGKMGDVSKGEGRTVLFVSHNLSSVRQLCNRGIVLANGKQSFDGPINLALEHYISQNRNVEINSKYIRPKDKKETEIFLSEAEVLDTNDNSKDCFDITEPIRIKFIIECKEFIPNTYGYIAIKNEAEETIIESDSFDHLPNTLEELKIGKNTFIVEISPFILGLGDHYIYVSIASKMSNSFLLDSPGDILKVNIVDHTTYRGVRRKAKTSNLLHWKKDIE